MFDLNTLSLSNLVALHNELAAVLNEKPVTKFSTKPIGIARFQKLLDSAGYEVFQQSEHVLAVRVASTEVDELEDTIEDIEKAASTPVQEVAVDAPHGLSDEADMELAKLQNADVEELAPAPKTKRAKKVKAPAAQRATYAEADVITVVALPKVREGSNRAARQAALKSGITVGAYLDAAVAANGKRSRHKFHADLLRFAKAGAITIAAPTAQ